MFSSTVEFYKGRLSIAFFVQQDYFTKRKVKLGNFTWQHLIQSAHLATLNTACPQSKICSSVFPVSGSRITWPCFLNAPLSMLVLSILLLCLSNPDMLFIPTITILVKVFTICQSLTGFPASALILTNQISMLLFATSKIK